MESRIDDILIHLSTSNVNLYYISWKSSTKHLPQAVFNTVNYMYYNMVIFVYMLQNFW